MRFIKVVLATSLTVASLPFGQSVHAVTWEYSNLDSQGEVVAYSADYPAQTAQAAAYWNSLAGTTVVQVTNNPAAATVKVEKQETATGDTDPNVALTYAPDGITDVYPARIATQGVDLQTVITHEMGHSLGLNHDPNSTLMAPAGGQLGGQAHDYEALKADLASHGREIDNAAFDAPQSTSVAESSTVTESASVSAPASSAITSDRAMSSTKNRASSAMTVATESTATSKAVASAAATSLSRATSVSEASSSQSSQSSVSTPERITAKTVASESKTTTLSQTVADTTAVVKQTVVEVVAVMVAAVAGVTAAIARFQRQHIDR